MEAVASYLRLIRFRRPTGKFFHRLFLLIFVIIVFGPLISLLWNVAQSFLDSNNNWLKLAIPTERRLDLLIRSAALASCVGFGAMLLGILAGSFLWSWRTGVKAYLRWFILLMVVVPPYVHALAWISATNVLSSLIQSLGLPSIMLKGWFASWWVQLMALSPIAIGMTLVGLESVDPELIEAARLIRPDIDCFKKICLPLVMPSILAGGGFVFLLSLTDYSVPSLFQLNVYSLEIFADYSASNEPARAFLLALPLLFITILVVSVSQSALRNAALKPLWHIQAWTVEPVGPRWLVCLQKLAAILVVVQILTPIISLTKTTGSWNNLIEAVISAHEEIVFTSSISSITGLACLPIAFAVGSKLVGSNSCVKLWWLVVTAPLAIPAPLVGIGMITIWNRPFLTQVYGSDLMPVLACLARFTPLAAIILLAQLRRVDPLLIDAARMFKTNTIRIWTQIRLPMIVPGLLAAACIVFALSAGELGTTLLVAPPGQSTLTMRIYNYLHYGASEAVAGLCLMMCVSTIVVALMGMIALQGWSWFFYRNAKR